MTKDEFYDIMYENYLNGLVNEKFRWVGFVWLIGCYIWVGITIYVMSLYRFDLTNWQMWGIVVCFLVPILVIITRIEMYYEKKSNEYFQKLWDEYKKGMTID